MPCFALVLTGPPGAAALTAAAAEKAWSLIPAERRVDRAWLAEGEAWQALIEGAAVGDGLGAWLRASAAAALARLPVDVNVVPDDAAARRKRLLVADMESTIIEQEMLDELADFVGLRSRVAAITERAMRGEIEFEGALRERVALLAGLDAMVLDEVASRITLMPGAETLIATMKAEGAYCALVSGGFTVFTSVVARRLGFDEHQANTIEVREGKLTGRVLEPVLGRQAKLAALARLSERLSLRPAETLAVGDGANDLEMIRAAGLGVAFRAKPLVAAEAGAAIRHGDLTALLHLQGYLESQFHRA